MPHWRATYDGPGGMRAASEPFAGWVAAADAARVFLEAAAPEKGYPTLLAALRDATADKPMTVSDGKHTLRIESAGGEADHARRAHAELGASSCHRWWNCPGSIRMSRGMPNRSTKAAELGTAAHEVAELCLRHGQDAVEYIGRFVNEIEIDEHTADKVQEYLDDCRSYDGPPEFVWTEVPVDLAALNPPAPMFGTADRAEYYPAEQLVKVKDYKNGYVYVPVPGNPQPMYYALGAVLFLGAERPVSRVEVTINQPEHGGPRRHTYDAVELVEWAAELMDRARATQAPDAPLVAGPWCKHCPAAGICEAQARHNLQTALVEFGVAVDGHDVDSHGIVASVAAPPQFYQPPAPDTLTLDQLSAVLDRADEFEAWIKSVRSYAIAINGVPGRWKVVETEGRDKWRDAAEAGTLIEVVHGVDPFVPREVASPAQLRARLAAAEHAARLATWEAAGKPKGRKPTKKAAEEFARGVIKPLVTRPFTGKALAPEFDSRPAIAGGGAEFLAHPLPAEAAQSVQPV